jgi:biotin-dependent carboxylase-like uncharacterized protein
MTTSTATTSTLLVERAGLAEVQDLGRPGFADLGIAVNGAADHGAARTANILVGNLESAPLVEVTGSELAVMARTDLLLAVTGAADTVMVDGHPQPAWETLSVSAGSRIVIPFPTNGFRSYLAINGAIHADRTLTSVSADPLLGVGTRLSAGDTLTVSSRYPAHSVVDFGRLFRLGARRPILRSTVEVRVTEGPDLGRLVLGRSALAARLRVRPQSNHVGLRLECPPIEQNSTQEIPSRGVPIGAVEVPPTGGIIILLRGRLVTAGYPVVAVVTSESLDLLGQVRPSDDVQLVFCDVDRARAMLRTTASERAMLSKRVQSAFRAKGLAGALDPDLTKETEEST